MTSHIIQSLTDFVCAHPYYVLVFVWFALIIALCQNVVYLLQVIAAWWLLRNYSQASDAEASWQTLMSETTLPVTIIVPAHNEATVIVESVRCLLALQYPELEIIVVNDGSSDDTLDVLKKAYDLKEKIRVYDKALTHEPIKDIYGSSLYSNLIVIDKASGHCKADAINAGINVSRQPLFCVVDADSLLDSGALLRAVRPFIEDPRRVVAVGGTIRVVNGCETRMGIVQKVKLPTTFVPLAQTMEYVRAFLMARTAFSQWGILLIISGAFGVFRRDPVIEAGGYSTNTVGEDMELIVKLHHYLSDQKREYAMRYIAEPVCWTQVPDTLTVLAHQRTRWQRGALESFFKHSNMFLNPRYGKIGLIAYPLSFLVDILGPLAEVTGYFLMTLFYFLNAIDSAYYFAFTGLVIFYGIFISVMSLIVEEEELWRQPRVKDLALLFFIAIAENFGYRQLNNLWRVIGLWQFLWGKKGWGNMERQAFLSTPQAARSDA